MSADQTTDREVILNRVLLAISEVHSGDHTEGLRIANAAIVALLQVLADTSGNDGERERYLRLCGWLRL